MNKIRLSVRVLFILTAALHFLQIFFLGVYFTTIGCFTFGAIYFALGIFVMNEKKWTLWASIILPTIGIIVSYVDSLTSPVKIAMYPLLVVIDIVIIILCIFELYKIKRAKAE